MSVRAFVGLGGNLGDVAEAFASALARMDALPGTQLLRASRRYRTPAWGLAAQPDFLNAVAMLETRLPARDLLGRLFEIERAHGRDRAGETRWGPRTLDLDLLLYGDAVIDEPGLRVPHPHLHERAFALRPLLEIAPRVSIPGHGPARDLPAAMAADGMEAIG
ncbi:MAG: 2-amino-4-hydroxy-6-hydroxymethyldihydropteridine diphosphokinase [Lysobacterales bacterium]